MHEGDGMLSILIPAYRAEATIADVVARALAADTERLGFRKQVVVCDDGSDRTRSRRRSRTSACA
jgi:glycosyltransferase involved in cell wall biosynthesis